MSFDYNFNKYLNSNLNPNKIYQYQTNDEKAGVYTYVDFTNAAFWFIPRYIVQKIGGFNPLFFHYGEDVNWSNRLHYHGYNFVCLLNESLVHDRVKIGNQFLFNENLLRRAIVLQLTNINKPFLLSLFLINVDIFKYLLRPKNLTFNLIFVRLIDLYRTYVFVFFNFRKFLHSRRIEKYQDKCWI
jgi:GT2 family glycosyltransferase